MKNRFRLMSILTLSLLALSTTVPTIVEARGGHGGGPGGGHDGGPGGSRGGGSRGGGSRSGGGFDGGGASGGW